MDVTRAVYGITTAADLSGVGVQSLRAYERRGLLEPARTDGGTRRYSQADLDTVQRIKDLLEAGVNLKGIELVLALERSNADLREQLDATPRRVPPHAG